MRILLAPALTTAALLALFPIPSHAAEPDLAPAQAPVAPAAAAPEATPSTDAPPATSAALPAAVPARAEPPPASTAPAPAPAAAGGHAPMGEEIVVTATRTRRPIGSVPVAVGVVGRTEIDRSPTKTMDELLRMDPSFALFRRSSSIAADPSSQGVKLRGVGPSAVSRTLVLVDGIPANDPYAGWVGWRSIPRVGVQSIEIVPGGASAVYGNYALGGVVQVLSKPIGDREMEVTSEVGGMGTASVAGQAAQRFGAVRSSVDGEFLQSQGYPVVASYARGAIDKDTPSKHGAVRARVEAEPTSELSLGLRGGFFWEDLSAGTLYTNAMARRFELAGTGRWTPGEVGSFDFALFGHTGEFQQNRAVVCNALPCAGQTGNAGRNAEALQAHQWVPTDDVGSSILWTSRELALAGTHTVNVGADGRWISGETRENLYTYSATTGAASSTLRDANAQQWLYGAFVQDGWELTSRLGLNVAVRYDRWDNVAASRLDVNAQGVANPTSYPDRSSDLVSPKVGVRFRALDWLGLRAAAYRSFRAPTLDEMYRPFQVGPARTLSNESLGPETLRGAETGIDVKLRGVSARVTGFWNEIDNPITNVTCFSQELCPGVTPPAGFTFGPNLRQKQNLGTARIRGVEAAASWTFLRRFSLGGAYTYADNEITDAPALLNLVGKRLPQDPVHMASAFLGFDDPRFLGARTQLRYLGGQYEDDQNQLAMGEAWLVDVSATWHLLPTFDVFFAIENLFDRTYLVGRAGSLDTIGQPRFMHGGVRLRTGG